MKYRIKRKYQSGSIQWIGKEIEDALNMYDIKLTDIENRRQEIIQPRIKANAPVKGGPYITDREQRPFTYETAEKMLTLIDALENALQHYKSFYQREQGEERDLVHSNWKKEL
ncbi:hypothetical protein HOK51_01060 [Candidatus Woesearchaeota archaeon]|jgi:hypothetical protein|nr:hypothetical protein [Candidatus Woesearchaeota archaeon]MBT6518404.1 hypothetical protein [Candidatus Woesearchaeota archaeon]MBT7366586.1 hypothetical protein [Candidatus Woesearchaeota archaeon]